VAEEGVLRVIDANFNRCKEGLRVVEDIFRFIIKQNALRENLRKLRHALDKIAQEKLLNKQFLVEILKTISGKSVTA